MSRLLTSLDAPQDAWPAEWTNINSPSPSLQALDIYPPTSQPALSALLTLIKRTASTLSSLSTSNRYEIQLQGTTIKQEQGKLKSLCMGITRLSVPFLDLLSRKFPQLEKLSLRTYMIIGLDQVNFSHLA